MMKNMDKQKNWETHSFINNYCELLRTKFEDKSLILSETQMLTIKGIFTVVETINRNQAI